SRNTAAAGGNLRNSSAKPNCSNTPAATTRHATRNRSSLNTQASSSRTAMPRSPRMASYAPSPPPGAERAGVRWGMPERSPTPTSPSRACGAGPSLSPLKGGEGFNLDRRNRIGGRADGAGQAQRRGGQQEARAAVGAQPVGEIGQ